MNDRKRWKFIHRARKLTHSTTTSGDRHAGADPMRAAKEEGGGGTSEDKSGDGKEMGKKTH